MTFYRPSLYTVLFCLIFTTHTAFSQDIQPTDSISSSAAASTESIAAAASTESIAAAASTDGIAAATEGTAIDTVDTPDKYTKIVLFSDHTWDYIDMGRPKIDTAGFYEGWSTEEIHAFKNLKPNNLPEEVDILLYDSIHPYCLPTTGKINSPYKFRRNREHNGIDIDLEIGDTIHAAFDGIVRYTNTSSHTGGYGNLVIIRHSNGLETYYGHLSKILVKSNELVKAGEIIGLGGSTGRSTGPHLHFEVRYKGQSFDPSRIFDFVNGTARDSILSLKRHYYSIYSHYGMTDEESKAAAGRIIHVVKSGDTLGGIAKRYGTTVTNICKLNGISSKKILRIGERLIVR